jgi:nitroimidazol reductase NimA-like FMN-containing flavoprotein (pyridoxamine 5'-phosphate oxidase superfamily)
MRGRPMERLDRDECIKLMERHPACVGRVALAGPRPVIFPVNYALDGANVVFRTDPGTKFHAAVHKAFVAFEVDWVEPTWQTGWSVVVRGQAHVVTDPEELARVSRLPLLPWAEGDKENFVCINAELVSGRRLTD